MDSQPLVTIILPVRNEAHSIARCLDAIMAQDYPRDRIEILLVDGMSNDRTREIVADVAARDARVRLLDNPQRIVPTALNRGIRAASGAIITRVDGHTLIAPDYVTRCVAALSAHGADNVGGPMRAHGETYMARGIALATSSPFGVGNARFHYSEQAGWVDTVYMGAYRRETFERVGLFDEELVRNQDDEFNFRLIRAGGKIWFDPSIRSTYFSRSTLRALWKQYFQYGYWKVRVIQKHGGPAAWRHLVPALFVTCLCVTSLMSLVLFSWAPLLLILIAYLGALMLATIESSRRRGWSFAPVLPFAFVVLHLAYGIGFLWGMLVSGCRALKPSRALHQHG
jgi:glycosyltransferase involved in cell wall biosynthesis